MGDLDSQSFDVEEAEFYVRNQIALGALDLLSNLFLASEQELKIKYGAAM